MSLGLCFYGKLGVNFHFPAKIMPCTLEVVMSAANVQPHGRHPSAAELPGQQAELLYPVCPRWDLGKLEYILSYPNL